MEIYEKEADAIFRYAILRVANRDDVLDIVQDTFAKFWQALNAGTSINYPRSFIFTIVRNKIIDWYRKKKPESLDAMMEIEDGIAFELPDEYADKEAEFSAEVSIILKALNKLPPQYREAVYLRFVEGLSPAEIAKVLGATPNTISIRINRGMGELRNNLGIDIK